MHFILIGILSAFLTIFLNYIIGKPGSDFSPYEIFSRYTIKLCIYRLKKIGLIDTYHKEFSENLKRVEDLHDYNNEMNNDGKKIENNPNYLSMRMDYHRILYQAAEPYFTWERAVGMCSICTGFWISLIVAICFYQNFVHCVSIIVISHVTIRILNKII